MQAPARTPPGKSAQLSLGCLELHHYTDGEFRLTLPKVREPDTAAATTAGRFGVRQNIRQGRSSAGAGEVLRQTVVSAGRRNTAAAREVRNVGVPITSFSPPDRKSTRLNSSHRCISY